MHSGEYLKESQKSISLTQDYNGISQKVSKVHTKLAAAAKMAAQQKTSQGVTIKVCDLSNQFAFTLV